VIFACLLGIKHDIIQRYKDKRKLRNVTFSETYWSQYYTIRMISSDVSIETGQYPVSKQSLNPSVSECDFSSVAYLCPFLGQRI
jgi:hypothetical protein